jgi:hypothetical protein
LRTAPIPLPAPCDPVRGRLQRAINHSRHRARTIGLALWAAALAVFAVHTTGIGIADPTHFSMLDSWLIGLGCIGCPIMVLRDLAARINLQVFEVVAVFCTALAMLLTALILGGALHYNTLDATFALILPLAAAIQATNAYDGEVHARRREQRARRRARLEILAEQYAQSHAALAGLDRLEAMSVEDLEDLVDTAITLIAEKRGEAHILHLPSPAERRRAKQRLDPA